MTYSDFNRRNIIKALIALGVEATARAIILQLEKDTIPHAPGTIIVTCSVMYRMGYLSYRKTDCDCCGSRVGKYALTPRGKRLVANY